MINSVNSFAHSMINKYTVNTYIRTIVSIYSNTQSNHLCKWDGQLCEEERDGGRASIGTAIRFLFVHAMPLGLALSPSTPGTILSISCGSGMTPDAIDIFLEGCLSTYGGRI